MQVHNPIILVLILSSPLFCSLFVVVCTYSSIFVVPSICVVEKPTTQQRCRKTYNLDTPGTKLTSFYVKPYNVDTL
jgi:hypothetical protein